MTSFTKILEKSCPAFNRLDISKERLASANITGNELRVLMIISYFTKSKGLCDVDNKTLELQFPKMNGNLFKYYLGNLQRKGMLFKKRVPIARIGGSRRILVTKITGLPAINSGFKKAIQACSRT